MSLVDEMLSEVEDHSVLFIKFMDISKCEEYKSKNLIPCIVEGDEDYSFYEPKMRLLLQAKMEKIVSGGIDEATKFITAINSSHYYSNSLFVVFLDSDFNLDSDKEGENDNRVFYLKKYSIENFFVTDEFFCNVLEGLTKLEKKRKPENGEVDENSDFVKVRDHVLSERDKLILLIEEYMICLRAIVTSDSEVEFKPFKDVLPKLSMDSRLINNNMINTSNFKDVFELDSFNQEQSILVESRILDSKDYFRKFNPLDSYRGKELIYIAHKVLASTKSVFHKNSGKITIKLKFSKQIKEEDFINDFSAYTEEPEGLREFINELKANYI